MYFTGRSYHDVIVRVVGRADLQRHGLAAARIVANPGAVPASAGWIGGKQDAGALAVAPGGHDGAAHDFQRRSRSIGADAEASPDRKVSGSTPLLTDDHTLLRQDVEQLVSSNVQAPGGL